MHRKAKRILAAAGAMTAAAMLATALDAHEPDRSPAPGAATGQGGMMGMKGMMPMKGDMGRMMEGCAQMMQGMMGSGDTPKPNEQWPRQQSPKPDEKD